MEKCKEMTNSDCTSARDLKEKVVLEPPAMNCVTDKKGSDKTVEDKNRNITLINSKSKLVLGDKQIPTSSSKENSNTVGLHVGPNGLVNGIEIGISGSLSHLIEHIPRSEMKESLVSPSQNTSCENTIDRKESDVVGRTDNENYAIQPSCSSASEVCGALVTETIGSSPNSSQENCNGKSSESTEVEYVSYKSELQMPDIMRLIQKDLSEPYSIYTYRYFIHNWPKLCFLVSLNDASYVNIFIFTELCI
jgi:hypothetical protein